MSGRPLLKQTIRNEWPSFRLVAMDDTLLKRADRAIREGQLIRDQARDGVMRAKITVAQIKGTRECARAEAARSRRLQLRMAGSPRSERF
jgi:hypothetical protein